ncbi:hypothetical protein, partial [Hungatella hathewayi]|uniref:hypothetical protein n=1 Tax=Hungatella hathewayi TaxID=154046 RepID=UPI001A9A3DF4
SDESLCKSVLQISPALMSTLQVYSYYISPFANSRESSKPDFHNSIAIRPLSVVYPASEGNHQAIL